MSSLGESAGTHHIEDLSSRAVQLTNYSAGLNIDNFNGKVIAGGGEEVVFALKKDGGDGGRKGEGSDDLHHLEVEELRCKVESGGMEGGISRNEGT